MVTGIGLYNGNKFNFMVGIAHIFQGASIQNPQKCGPPKYVWTSLGKSYL
jgi:hypothetical protein